MIPGSTNQLLTAQRGYRISNSLRFRSSASAYLSRTFGTPTNNKIFTWSCWFKIGTIPSAREGLFIASNAGGTTFFGLEFNASAGITLWDSNYSGASAALITSQVFRDPSSWYHLVMSVDFTQVTASNRVKLYLNGSQITTFTSANYAAQNSSPYMNSAISHSLGSWQPSASLHFDGYLTEVNFIDGQALDATSFGQTDNNGVWQPKAYTGTYGTNGFYLKFDEVGATTTTNTGYGKDSSGNANRWTTNNFGTTSTATTYDSMLDSPTNYDNGGNGVGNYCVLNPLIASSNSFSQGNLVAAMGSVTNAKFVSTMGVTSGKWYMEFAVSSWANCPIGITSTTVPQAYLSNADASTSVAFWPASSGTLLYANNASQTFSGSSTTWAGTDIAGLALDADSGTISLYKNGTLVGSAVSYTSYWTGVTYFAGGNYVSGLIYYANFGQRPFAYMPPTGFKALNTQNLTTPTIANGAQYMNATLYTGNGAARSITGLAFSPDLVWIKSRSNALDNKFTDSVRGVTKALISNTTGAETTDANGLTAFNADGFSLGTDATYNTNTNTYVAWAWGKSVTSGCDIVTYTGNGANRTIAHSLGAIPDMIIVKQRTAASATNWAVYHSSLANTEYLLLNSTAAKATGATYWNSTTPTSSVFSLGTAADVNTSSGTYVAYLWDAVAGYSAFGSYTGNGSTDGPFVYCGFKPRWIMIKNTADNTTSWSVWDTSRSTYNVPTERLEANGSAAESSLSQFDILSNGFKLRVANSNNTSSQVIIYAAFAENPFKISRAR